jgi:hypothetical protein
MAYLWGACFVAIIWTEAPLWVVFGLGVGLVCAVKVYFILQHET